MKGTKRKHRLLSILLSLMLVVGLMPAMSTTVFAANTITTVEASGIKAPVAGESVDSSYESVTLPSGGGYEQLGVILWYEDAVSDEAAPFYGPFAAGHKYYAVVSLDVTANYQFANDITVRYAGKAPYSQKVNGSNTTMSFAVEFTCPTNIDPVTVTELTITYDTDACKIDTSKTEAQVSTAIKNNASLAQDGTITNTGKFSASLVYWNTSQWQAAGTDPISSSRQYAFSFEVPLKEGYSWPEEIFTDGDMSRVKITINGEVYKPASNMINYIPSSDRYVAICYVPAEQKSNISKISATMAKPTLYKSPSYEVTAAGEGYKVSVENWYSAPTFPELTGGTVMTSTDKFREGTRYMAELKFTADEGYNFVDGISVGVTNSSGWRIDSQDSKSIVVFVNMGYAQHEHNYQNVITKATTSANGYIGKECAICGDKITETIYYPKTMKLSTTNYTYSGGTKKPSVSIIDANGNTISSANYNVFYATGCKSVGRYKVTVTFKGDKYSGSKYTYFYINPKGTSISKVSGAKKAFTVKWKKQSSKMATSTITGYQIRYSTSSKMTSAKTKTVKGYKYTSKKITKLSAKKKYYVQVRTYKTVSGKTYYSSWSGVKSVKTK